MIKRKILQIKYDLITSSLITELQIAPYEMSLSWAARLTCLMSCFLQVCGLTSTCPSPVWKWSMAGLWCCRSHMPSKELMIPRTALWSGTFCPTKPKLCVQKLACFDLKCKLASIAKNFISTKSFILTKNALLRISFYLQDLQLLFGLFCITLKLLQKGEKKKTNPAPKQLDCVLCWFVFFFSSSSHVRLLSCTD